MVTQIDCSKVALRPAVKLLVTEKGKQYEIYKRIFDAVNNVHKWTQNGVATMSLSRKDSSQSRNTPTFW